MANKYDKGRLIEFYTLSERRQIAVPMCQELLAVSRATHIEAQTNNPLMVLVLFDCAKNVKAENVLFADAFSSNLSCPAGQFRHTTTGDGVEDEWLVEAGGQVVASGGFLCHYNPPYGDIYMQVSETARRRGFGSYFVQEVKRVCYEAGKKPGAARCDADNLASRKTLEKAGMLPCGRLLVGKVALAPK